MDPQEEMRTHLRAAVVVGMAIIISLVVYLALVEVLRSVLKPFRGFAAASAGGGGQTLRLALFGAAAIVVLLILVLRHSLFRVPAASDPAAAYRRLQGASFMVLVLGEIPAVLGLALFLIAGDYVDFYALFFASLVLTFINYPRRAAWEDALKGCPLCQGRVR
jgi:hypothetical protein